MTSTTPRAMRIGLVCPYSFDVPGGVQFHVRDLAEALIAQGHHVSVLAPADDDTPIPPYMTSAGRAVPVRYNGAVARMTFGPLTAARVRRWLVEPSEERDRGCRRRPGPPGVGTGGAEPVDVDAVGDDDGVAAHVLDQRASRVLRDGDARGDLLQALADQRVGHLQRA